MITLLGLAIFIFLFFPQHANALQQTLLYPILDNTLYEDTTGALSNGAGHFLFAGRTRLNENRRALMRFDLVGNVPEGAVVDSVRVRMYMSRSVGEAFAVGLHRVISDWGEGESKADANEGKGAPAEAGDATWVHAFYDQTRWANLGGDFMATPSAERTIGDEGIYAWSSSALAMDVGAWVANPEENFGWVFIGDESATLSAKRFNSVNHPDSSTHPALEIFYSMPTAKAFNETPIIHQLYPVYPNPFTDRATLLYDQAYPAEVTVRIVDVLGREVAAYPLGYQPAGQAKRVGLRRQGWAPGLYVVRVIFQDQRGTHVKSEHVVVR